MSPWHPPSLVPLVGLSLLLGGGVLWRRRARWPIAAFCLALAGWGAAVWLASRPDTQRLGTQLLMLGFFIPATFAHVVDRELDGNHAAVAVGYGLATVMLVSSLAVPGLYLTDGGTGMGPLFWPMFVLSGLAGLVSLWWLARADPEPGRRETRRYLMLAGAATTGGGALHILLSLAGNAYPLGLYLILSAIGLMTYVALAAELPSFSRFAERSQRYTFLAALMSTVWMLALLWATSGEATGPRWTWESALLLFVLTLTAQPLLTEARSQLVRVVVPGADAEGLSRALAHSEARAEHAERLAEIGRLSSAVAHEVRNPLGVISACVSVLEHQGADPALLDEVRGAVDRANRFSADLLDYGRPAPVTRHPVALEDVASVAWGEVQRALGEVMSTEDCTLHVDGRATVQADGAQLTRLLATLFENALLAGARTITVSVSADRVVVDDDGPGVPEALADSVFEAFVTGRGRDAPRPGTGLGLAIARGIAQRHGGELRLEPSDVGARFVLELPPTPAVPAEGAGPAREAPPSVPTPEMP